MGLGVAAIQNILELNNLGYFKNLKNVVEIGSQELHLTKADLEELFKIAGLNNNLIEDFPNVKNWPFSPRCPSKHLYKALGIENYQCIDVKVSSFRYDLGLNFAFYQTPCSPINCMGRERIQACFCNKVQSAPAPEVHDLQGFQQ